MSWVQIPPRAVLFPFSGKGVVLGGMEFFSLPLPCCLIEFLMSELPTVHVCTFVVYEGFALWCRKVLYQTNFSFSPCGEYKK